MRDLQVMLSPAWGDNVFRRSIRKKTGEIIRTLEFHKGKPLELTEEECHAVGPDIGKALVLVYYEEREGSSAPPVLRVDWKETEATRNHVDMEKAEESALKADRAVGNAPKRPPRKKAEKPDPLVPPDPPASKETESPPVQPSQQPPNEVKTDEGTQPQDPTASWAGAPRAGVGSEE